MTGNVTNSSVLETCYLGYTAEPTELWYSSAVYTKEVTSLIFKITKPTLFDVYRAPNTRSLLFNLLRHALTNVFHTHTVNIVPWMLLARTRGQEDLTDWGKG